MLYKFCYMHCICSEFCRVIGLVEIAVHLWKKNGINRTASIRRVYKIFNIDVQCIGAVQKPRRRTASILSTPFSSLRLHAVISCLQVSCGRLFDHPRQCDDSWPVPEEWLAVPSEAATGSWLFHQGPHAGRSRIHSFQSA